jgi:predicted transposase/invertase (TIGR01784 family)
MKNKKYDKNTVDMRARYVNPFTDFGFKKIFGEEASKPLLIDFLNSLLPEQNRIRDLTFKNNEQMPSIDRQRACVYDLHCEGDRGERFIVELQKVKYDHFKERMIFYSTFPIREQVEKGEQSFKFNPVFSVAILDYIFKKCN